MSTAEITAQSTILNIPAPATEPVDASCEVCSQPAAMSVVSRHALDPFRLHYFCVAHGKEYLGSIEGD